MSTFVIFVIVLTLGYILYYAAMITIDMTAKSKTETAMEETISADGISDDEEEYAPRSVVENAATGGFSFMEPYPDGTEAHSEDINEAEEIDEPTEEPLEVSTSDENGPVDIQEPESMETDSAETEDNATVESPISDEQEQIEERPVGDDPTEAPESDAAPEAPFSEASNITIIDDVEEEPVKKEDDEPFDEDKFFDKTLFTPQYGVTEIVAPAVTEQTVIHAIETNSALDSILTKDFGMDVSTLKEVMHQGSNNKYGLELTDEVQKY
jgi:hypothetical protein